MNIKGIIKIAIYILIIYIIGNIVWQFITINIKSVNISGELKTLLYGDIRSDEYTLKDRVMQALREREIYLEYDMVTVHKISNNRVRFYFEYTDSITIPFINKYFYINKKIDETVMRR